MQFKVAEEGKQLASIGLMLARQGNDLIGPSEVGENMAMAGKVSISPKRAMVAQQDDFSLSEERIVSVARHLMETLGLESVTMRRVAAELGVTAMALYHHVADKQALVALVADQVIDLVPEPGPQGGPWYDRLRQGLLAVHEQVVRYPGLGLYMALNNGFYPSGFRKSRRTLQLLVDAGFEEDEAKTALYVLLNYTAGYFAFEQSIQRPPIEPVIGVDEVNSNILQSKAELHSYDVFVQGLDTIIAGLRAQLAK